MISLFATESHLLLHHVAFITKSFRIGTLLSMTHNVFALIQCHRKTSEGQPVKKYSELIEYLMAKDPGIKALQLDFEGKNILLYHLADLSDSILRDPAMIKHLVCKGPATREIWREFVS